MSAGHRATSPDVEAVVVDRLAAVLERHSGIRLQRTQRPRLLRAAAHRMDELGGDDLLAYLRRVEQKRDEWRWFIPHVAVGETSFFRDRERWVSLEQTLLPAMAGSAPTRALRLWSAGCATGQEAYSLGMVCERLRDRFSGMQAEVVGSDVNPEALAVAERGVYGEPAVRGLEPRDRDRFFEPCAEGYRVGPELRAHVRFEALNLAEWAQVGPWPQRFDLILCQNVLIYLAPRVTRRVLLAMASSLNGGGMLLVGHSETMTPPEGCVLEWIGAGCGFRKRQAPPAATGFGLREAGPEPPAAPADPPRTVAEAWDDVVAERYAAARERLVGDARGGEGLRLLAWIAVCREEWDEARRLVARALADDADHAEAHFVAGMLAAGTGAQEEAVRMFKRAVYLDPAFSVAHFHLAELEAGLGHAGSARRSWRNAARAGAADALRIRRYFGGFDAEAFAQACDGRGAATQGTGP